jgi:hypothetical protein
MKSNSTIAPETSMKLLSTKRPFKPHPQMLLALLAGFILATCT